MRVKKTMEKKRIFNVLVVSLLIASTLISCSPNLAGPSGIPQEDVARVSARVIEKEYDRVRSALIESGEYSEEDFASFGELDGESVVRGALENGNEDVLNFLYSTCEGKSTGEILQNA